MPAKSKKSKVTARPAGRKPPQAKAKLWVLWEPPIQILLVTAVIAVFASAGFVAIRFSDAADNKNRQASDSQLLWQDVPASPVGSLISANGTAAPLHNWRTAGSYVYGGGTIRVVADDTKNKAIEFFGAANMSQADAYGNNQRAEQIADLSLKKGGTYWFGFDIKVAPGGGVASGRQSVWQILPQPDRSQAKLWLALNSNREGLSVEADRLSLTAGQVPDTSWVRIVLGVHLADDDSAWVEIWRDGQQIAARQPVPGGVLAKNVNSGLMAAGLYRSQQSWDAKVRMANLKIATTRDAAL